VDQFGVSACGPTAICNVILGLLTIHRKSKHLIENHVLDDLEELLDPDVLSKGIPPRLRDYNAPLGVCWSTITLTTLTSYHFFF
jgi:hypothetical protein